ncbi:phosphoenolpyruvate synthase [Ponticoccus sp. SC2-23]|uniref:phosphoenolpyruvate synthase n=1 Tax=Alexandriicola marinus TaxID=2081710 RepID=UPI000FD832E5|nr:phosphoenolpyruvate synthase [Alexandriicola marinus]MBM1220948.1 phosphoenolpyruvate synthase [Ponticoccus sp. SC6-9]MBM1225518.1 phosphoenolpyruvate synthase [Ponticoccus sp. SC6-15]MBM1227701.1 phosphoenolpyruvate synthase [Ponticoccus sp. SC6-38]MBM1234661.1 phosphoenolpyruvate synthase [Ponticoccus sp. SC6-45]MBM1238203.1 phosphoenolpyruvate synthase [Ponticoccus sp. SC6-49]MBM1244164.1 phosphoenolpyruvate synthase [Ponticoccus sp. SC2-64]MBM1248185.1 phosphoenolpyruvate synthase [Po
MARTPEVIFFENLRRGDVALVGGKNSSLGEMVQELDKLGVSVPPGFATTAEAFRRFISENALDAMISDTMDRLASGKITLHEAGQTVRSAIAAGDWPAETAAEIGEAYKELSRRAEKTDLSVAVRSSATAEDLPDASFAGQQETFLNIEGEEALLKACRDCYASLFTDRAISYRNAKGFDHLDVALSVGVQQMVRSDIGGSGVMFSIDSDSGFDKVVVINAAWGLGENVVQGAVTPDEFQVYKPFLEDRSLRPIIERKLGAKEKKMIYAGADDAGPVKNVPTSKAEKATFVLSDDEVIELARQAATIETHYGLPMDMEWARDGETGKLYIVQARPETVQSHMDSGALKSFTIGKHGRRLITGLSVGEQIATGRICLIEDVADIDKFVDGAVLVTSTTDPDWVPIMKRASAIITDHGGRTSHAAIVSRELGVPAIVGCGDATHVLHDEQDVTVCCAEGDEGFVYEGIAEYEVEKLDLDHVPETRTKVMLNLANPSTAARWWRLPADGVGLARMEFVINNAIQIHPEALIHFDKLRDEKVRDQIESMTVGYPDKSEYFVDKLSRGLSRIAAVCYPNPMILRLSDFKTNEYADLIGGTEFEPVESNPMIGWRGASRYYDPAYRDGFALECRAIHRLREEMGFRNVKVMVPFCRTPEEADRVLAVMAEEGLERGQDGLEFYVMCEVPSNVIMAEEFSKRFDGFSIGSNDLTQLTLGIDRDSDKLSGLFNERDPAVVWMIRTAIEKVHAAGRKIGLCGQAPSNYPEFARVLVDAGIDSISVTPDSFLNVKNHVAAAESD